MITLPHNDPKAVVVYRCQTIKMRLTLACAVIRAHLISGYNTTTTATFTYTISFSAEDKQDLQSIVSNKRDIHGGLVWS